MMKSESEIDYKIKLRSMDDILHQISCMSQAEDEAALNETLPCLLRAIGEYTSADRVYIFDWASDARISLSNTFEWCAPGVSPEIANLQEIPAAWMPAWMDALWHQRTILIESLDDIAQSHPQEYEFLKAQDIQSVIALPIYANHNLMGFIGLDNPDFSQDYLSIKLLSDVGSHLGSIRENMRMFHSLEEKRRTLQQTVLALQSNQQMLTALFADYTAMYECDLLADTLTPIKLLPYTDSVLTEHELQEKQYCYSARIRYYNDKFVQKTVSPDFLSVLDASQLMRQLSVRDRLLYQFCAANLPNGNHYYELQAVRLSSNLDSFRVLIGFRSIDETLRAERIQQEKLQAALQEQMNKNEIISAISKIYWMIFLLDLNTDTYEILSDHRKASNPIARKGCGNAKILAETQASLVAPPYRMAMNSFLDLSTLSQRLRNVETVACEYCSLAGNWHLGRFIVKSRDPSGNVASVLYVVQEINAQKAVELEYQSRLLHSMEEAKRANAAKTTFLNNMSHDIRTPMNAIIGFTNIALKQPASPEVHTYLEKISSSSDHLLSLINDVLDISRIESGHVKYSPAPVDLLKITDEVLNIINGFFANRDLDFQLLREPNENLYVMADAVRIREVLVNLLSNAVKYTDDGGSITFETSHRPGPDAEHIAVTYRIADTGIGMSEEFQKKLFEDFSQEAPGARTQYKGTGLGLAITKRYVDLMGGKLTVQSKKGVGSTFIVELPLAVAHKADIQQQNHICQKRDAAGLNILLAEDNDLNAEIAAIQLEEHHFAVTRVANGAEALRLFAARPAGTFDLILMDIMMPEMNGYEATKRIRTLPGRPDGRTIPIIAMSANAFAEDVQASLEAGMNDHLAKPIVMETVLQTILKNLEQ